MRPGRWWLVVIAVSLMLAVSWSLAAAQEAPRIDKETLKSWLGNPQVLIIDVRQPRDWESSDKKIQGAVRENPHNVDVWAATLPKNQKIVLYCAWPDEATSARVAQKLIDMGFPQVWALQGGWNGWERAGYPTEPKWT